MKKISLLFLMWICVLSQGSGAATKSHSPTLLQVFILGGNVRHEREISQEIKNHYYFSNALAFRKDNWSGSVEFSNRNENTGNISSSIDRTHREWMGWGRFHFYNENTSYSKNSVYAGLGFGSFREEIETTLMGDNRFDQTDNFLISGLAFGWDGTLYLTPQFGIASSFEIRILNSKEFEPNPTADETIKLGLEYRFK